MKKSFINKYLQKFGFEVHGTGYIQSLQKGSFKEDAFDKQKEITGSRVSTIFDIGANRGSVALRYHELFPSADIYAFEPFPGTFEIMTENTKAVKKIHCFQNAVAENKKNHTLYVNTNVDTNSLFKPQKTGLTSDNEVKNVSTIEVEGITIDDFCKTNGITQIDILKLDIQGGELSALKGAKEMLASKRIRLIYTEAFFVEQYENQPLFYHIADYLHQHQYHLQDIYSPAYGKGSIAWCDAIFLG